MITSPTRPTRNRQPLAAIWMNPKNNMIMKRILSIIFIFSSLTCLNAQVRDSITYNTKSRLDWSDFKMIPNSEDTLRSSNLYVTIQMGYKKVNVWTGIATFEAYGFVLRDSSWVKPTFKSDLLLDYMQLQYDISNLLAKQLENEINSEKINAGNRKKTGKYFYFYVDKLERIINKMDNDTNYGRDENMIERWKNKYNNGLINE
jgi:hypothetical protein